MKTEKEIIDELGDWLCTDMEKDLVRDQDGDGKMLMDTEYGRKLDIIRAVGEKIHWYANNVADR